MVYPSADTCRRRGTNGIGRCERVATMPSASPIRTALTALEIRPNGEQGDASSGLQGYKILRNVRRPRSRCRIVTYLNYVLWPASRLATSASASQSRYSASVHPQSVTSAS